MPHNFVVPKENGTYWWTVRWWLHLTGHAVLGLRHTPTPTGTPSSSPCPSNNETWSTWLRVKFNQQVTPKAPNVVLPEQYVDIDVMEVWLINQ